MHPPFSGGHHAPLARDPSSPIIRRTRTPNAGPEQGMTLSQYVFFACWLVAALLGGAGLVYIWPRLFGRFDR